MTTTEHLNAIKAKCHKLLAIAEKRAPGQWRTSYSGKRVVDSNQAWVAVCDEGYPADAEKYLANAAFIASTAGPLEASLRATIAAIETVQELLTFKNRGGEMFASAYGIGETMAKDILAAWPLELL